MGAKFRSAPAVVTRAMHEAAQAVKADAEKSTATWKHKVTFTITQSGASFTIATNDEIYKFVDEGTRPHIIVPRNARVLRFATGGSPKTTPGRITAGGGSKGSGVVFTGRVNHPGTKARYFTKQLQKTWARGTAPYIARALEAHFR